VIKNNKTIIISYTFPPTSGVGGRRWAKLSNALCESGQEVHVFCAKPGLGETSHWNVHHSLIVNRFPKKYPQALNRVPTHLFDKIHYRLSLFILKLITKGNYYDRGVFWEKYFEYIYAYMQKNSIRNLIVTGGPFSLLYYAAKLKVLHPEIKYLADIRDEWGANEFYGFGLLSENRKTEECKRLKLTLQHADRVLVPYPYMKEKYTQKVPDSANKIKILPHGVDAVFFRDKKIAQKHDTMNLVNFGSIHSGQEEAMTNLASVLGKIPVHIQFYTHEKKYENIFRSANTIPNRVSYYNPVEEKKVAEILSESDAALLFIPNYFRDSISTKFMEIIATRTPIVAIGIEGEASEFIIKNKLGIFIPYSDIYFRMKNLKEELENLNYNDSFDISPYHFSNQAKQVLNILQKI
jgi:glycosyltransferase involved in cell wall biosynthesis